MKTTENRKNSVLVSRGWVEGFICAICQIIRLKGTDSNIEEIFQSGVSGNRSLAHLRQHYNIDESDLEILILNESVLFKPTQNDRK